MYRNNLGIQQHGKKLKVEDDHNSNHDNQEQVLFYDFWNEAPDDVLTEIFIRHPNCRSALRTTLVCRRWRSLISRNPHYIEQFKSHHRRHHDRYPPESLPWAILLRKSRDFQPLLQLHSDEWVFLHGKFPDNCFDFLPQYSPCMVIVKASCNDLFLVSISPADQDHHYVCNPITKQFVHLPSIPRLGDQVIIYALVLTQSGPTADDMRFKVVVILPPRDYPPSLDLNLEPKRIVPVTIYSSNSESRVRETRSFLVTSLYEYDDNYVHPMDIITCNRVLYWMGTTDNRESHVVGYLDLSKEKSGVIHIPSSSGDMFICKHRIGIVHVSGGLQELRLLRVDMHEYAADILLLKVWTLKDDGSNCCWTLVHDTTSVAPEILSHEFPLAGAFFHPTNGDLVFIVLGKNVIEYNIGDGMYRKVGELGKMVSWPLTPFLMVGA